MRRSAKCTTLLIALVGIAEGLGGLFQTDLSWMLPAPVSSVLIIFGAPDSRFAWRRAVIGGYCAAISTALLITSLKVPLHLVSVILIAAALVGALILDALHPPAVGFAVTVGQHSLWSIEHAIAALVLTAITCGALATLVPRTRPPKVA